MQRGKMKKMNNHTQQVLDDPSASYFTKQIIREGLEKDPVDAVTYVELALLILKEELLSKLDIHMILDNYGTHGHPNVKLWLEKHPRFKLHFTPTSSSWLNLIERWFGEITRKRIRRDIFRSVPELIDTIEEYIRCNNENPKPFIWIKRADEINYSRWWNR
jgi:transposase